MYNVRVIDFFLFYTNSWERKHLPSLATTSYIIKKNFIITHNFIVIFFRSLFLGAKEFFITVSSSTTSLLFQLPVLLISFCGILYLIIFMRVVQLIEKLVFLSILPSTVANIYIVISRNATRIWENVLNKETYDRYL